MPMRRLRWVAVVVTIAIACGLGAAVASASPTGAAHASAAANKKKRKPGKRKPTPCKPGQAQLRIGKRTICVTHSLPTTSLTPRAVTVSTALNLGIGKTRDRHGRRSPTLAKLLRRAGPHARASLEKAISIGLTRGEDLALGRAQGARAAVSRAFASSSECGSEGLEQARKELEEAPQSQKEQAQREIKEAESGKSAKIGEAELSLGIENGATKLGIDIKAKGVSVSVSIRSCGEGGLKVDNCPTAEGKVEGHGHAELEATFKISEGAKLLMAQGFKFSGETTVKAQTGDDGKLDYYDIKHVYSLVGSFGGSKAKFGPITVDTTYIGEAHIDMRSGGGTPPPAQVDVMMSMAGVDPAERIAAEIKVAREAQAEADKEFSAEVEKTTKRLRAQEAVWLKPNECASLHFEPASESLKLKKGDSGTVKSRTEAKGGGAPPTATWTLSGEQNASFTPGGSEGNPLSTSYDVTNAGKGLIVSATFKATSKAGVAEGTWKQRSENVIQTMTGTFTGRDERGGELLEWSGTATFSRIPESPEGTSILELVSSEVTITASGVTPTGCSQTGKEQVPVFAKSPFTVLGEGAPGVMYDIDVPFTYPGQMNVTFFGCPPHGEGDGPGETMLPGEALLSGDPLTGGPSALLQTSTDGITFAGSAGANGDEPGEMLHWTWSMTGSS
jgi:hypothetical protein